MRQLAVRTMISLVCVVLLLPGLALAKGNIHVGKMQVIPGLKYQLEYNDNIFLDPSGEEEEFIHTITPSLALDWARDKANYVRLGYAVDVVRYDDFGDTDYEKHMLRGRAKYTAPSGFYAQAREYFVDTEDPYGSLNDFNTGEQTARWNNSLRLRSGYSFAERMRAEVSYNNYIQKYDAFEDEWQNKLDHEPGVAFYYKFWPKTSALFEYRYQMREYTEQQDLDDNSKGIDSDTAQDFNYHQFFVGLHWDATAKITGDLKLGYGLKDYENDVNWRGEDYDDNDTWIAETRLAYRLAPKTRLTARLLRRVRNSSSDDGSTEYENTKVGFGLQQRILRRYTVKAGVAYTKKDYDENSSGESRDDDVYEGNLGVDYRFNEWLNGGVTYTYKDRQSNFADDEYTSNVFTVHIGAEY